MRGASSKAKMCVLFVILHVCASKDNKYVLIKHKGSGFVMDASESEVKLQKNRKIPAQFWKLEATHDGKFVIVNVGNGQAVDIPNGIYRHVTIITDKVTGKENQQFFINSDGSLVTAKGDLALEMKYWNSGSKIITYFKNGGRYQRFEIESVNSTG